MLAVPEAKRIVLDYRKVNQQGMETAPSITLQLERDMQAETMTD